MLATSFFVMHFHAFLGHFAVGAKNAFEELRFPMHLAADVTQLGFTYFVHLAYKC